MIVLVSDYQISMKKYSKDNTSTVAAVSLVQGSLRLWEVFDAQVYK